MEENSPVKHKHTSKVIDSLHSQIDTLKTELDSVRVSSDDYKKKYSLLSKKNESFVDQLANAKHENDMINALLKRKERRIADLEDQYNELSSTNETLQLSNKSMRIRCENLQESSASSTAEFERLKIAYDALIASQVEYKKHYQKEVTLLTSQFESYKLENNQRFESLSQKLSNNDKDVDTLLDSLSNKRKTMDNLYVNKNKTILELLTKLAKASRLHGQESKATLQDSVDTIQALLLKHPDLQAKLSQHEKVDIDLEEFLNESTETLYNCSFDEEATLINSPDLADSPSNNDSNSNTPSRPLGHSKTSSISRSNTVQSKRRKNKRNSLRFDSKSGPDFSSLNTPTTPTQLTLPKRPNMTPNMSQQGPSSGQHSHGHNNQYQKNNQYYDSKPRTPTPPTNSNLNEAYEINPNYQFNRYANYNNQPNHAQQYNNSNNNNNNSRGYRNNSNNNYSNQNQHHHSHSNSHQGHQNNDFQHNNNNSNNNSKKFNRRSYNNNGNNNNYNKRNSQVFEPNNLNLALNT